MASEYNKAKIIKGFKKVVDERSLDSMTTLYHFFIYHCSFIAHYNIHGFKNYYSGRDFLEFLRTFTYPPFSIYCNNEYEEWFQEMSNYAKENEKQILFEFENKTLDAKLRLMQQLAKELGCEVQSKNQSQIESLSVDSDGQFRLAL